MLVFVVLVCCSVLVVSFLGFCFVFVYLFFCVCDRLLPCNLGWPGTHSMDQTSLKYIEISLPLPGIRGVSHPNWIG